MLKDATASFSDEEMHAALEVNIANYNPAEAVSYEDSITWPISSAESCRVRFAFSISYFLALLAR